MFDFDVAQKKLEQLEQETPPAARPDSMRAFIIANIARINKLIERGWPVGHALQQIAQAANADTSERTLIQYFRAAQKEQPPSSKSKMTKVKASAAPAAEPAAPAANPTFADNQNSQNSLSRFQ